MKVVEPPDELPPKGDVIDGIQKLGWGRDEIEEILAGAKDVGTAGSVSEGAEESNQAIQLIRNRSGDPKPILANAISMLRQAPEWKGVLAYNEFSLGTVATKQPPWGNFPLGSEWTDHEDRLTADWLQRAGICVTVETAGQAVQTVAKDRWFHPVREYLDALRWDGTPRLESWPSKYLGVAESEYAKAVGKRWLISGVARIFRPGTKADCCAILEGDQGALKSTALKILAGEWFTDEIEELGSKDAALQTRGVWIIEIAELDSMSRGEVSKIKAFMSRSVDRFRPPYGKHLIRSPRQCIFAGSVNLSTYLRDETGGRRFWPIKCGAIDIDALARDRDQLWAEAVCRFRAGEPWWLDSVDLNRAAEKEQEDRYEPDPWDEIIRTWIRNPSRHHSNEYGVAPFSSTADSVTSEDILWHCIGKRTDQWNQQDKNRVAKCLRAAKWERYRHRFAKEEPNPDDKTSEWRYRRKR